MVKGPLGSGSPTYIRVLIKSKSLYPIQLTKHRDLRSPSEHHALIAWNYWLLPWLSNPIPKTPLSTKPFNSLSIEFCPWWKLAFTSWPWRLSHHQQKLIIWARRVTVSTSELICFIAGEALDAPVLPKSVRVFVQRVANVSLSGATASPRCRAQCRHRRSARIIVRVISRGMYWQAARPGIYLPSMIAQSAFSIVDHPGEVRETFQETMLEAKQPVSVLVRRSASRKSYCLLRFIRAYAAEL